MNRVRMVGLSLLAGCVVGCGGAGTATDSGNDGTQRQFGAVTTRLAGPIQPPVVLADTNVVVTAVFGADILNATVKLPPITQMSAEDVVRHTNLVFSRWGRPYVYDFESGHALPLLNQPTYENVDCSPSVAGNGSRFAYSAYDPTSGWRHIFTATIDGTDLQKLTSGSATSGHPDFSPDGTKVTYTLDNGQSSKIGLVSAIGGSLQILTDETTISKRPKFSPDGRKIAYLSSVGSANAAIVVMNKDGTNKNQLVPASSWPIISFDWSGDGSEIIAVMYRNGYGRPYSFFRFQMSGVGDPFYDSANPITSVTCSPDGGSFAYTVNEAAPAGGTYVSRFVDPKPVQITQDRDESVSWGPYVQSRTFVGTGGSLGTSSGGFLFAQRGLFVPSFVTFDAPTRSALRVTSLTPIGGGLPNVLCDIKGSDPLKMLKYINSMTGSVATVVGPNTPATGALVSYDTSTGKVASVLPYTTSQPIVKAVRTGIQIQGQFCGVWNAAGKNTAQNGATSVTIDPKTGKVVQAS